MNNQLEHMKKISKSHKQQGEANVVEDKLNK